MPQAGSFQGSSFQRIRIHLRTSVSIDLILISLAFVEQERLAQA